MTRGTCPSSTFYLEEVKLSTMFSLEINNVPFGGANLPLREKDVFLKEHSLNLLVSFSLRALNLPYGGVGLSTTFFLGGTNSSSGDFVFPFGENFLSLENRLYCFVPYYIPFIDFSQLENLYKLQTTHFLTYQHGPNKI